MNARIVNIIIRREYLNRVKKKSFLVTTFVVPILFAAMCILPSVIMALAKEENKTIAVIDNSGIVMPYLDSMESATFVDYSSSDEATVKGLIADGTVDALLTLSPIDSSNSVSAVSYASKPLGLDMSDGINKRINDAVEDYRINQYKSQHDSLDLKNIITSIKSNVAMKSFTIDENGGEKISESSVYMIVSMLLGMVIYLFVTMFGGMVMSSVIEEKSSRVVEVLVSSVKATELMFGKIIGVALVAITQFFLWIVLAAAIIGVVGVAVPSLDIQQLAAASDPTGASTDMAASAMPSEVGTIVGTLAGIPWAEVLVAFIVFFIFGYLLYASMFAAIGSAVENEGDSQQLQMPLTIPLLLAFFIAIYTFKAPDSAVVFWGSIIPFTSPIVMLARIPFGVPVWQMGLSIALLIATFVLCAWVSAKIYKVGILMFGKKSTFKDLWKWFKQK